MKNDNIYRDDEHCHKDDESALYGEYFEEKNSYSGDSNKNDS